MKDSVSVVLFWFTSLYLKVTEAHKVCDDYYLAFNHSPDGLIKYIKPSDIDFNKLSNESLVAYEQVRGFEDCILDFECAETHTACVSNITSLIHDKATGDVTKESNDTTNAHESTIVRNVASEMSNNSNSNINNTALPKSDLESGKGNRPKIYSEANGDVRIAYTEQNCPNKTILELTVNKKCAQAIYEKDGKRFLIIQCEFGNYSCPSTVQNVAGGAAFVSSKVDKDKLLLYIIAAIVAIAAIGVIMYYVTKGVADKKHSAAYHLPEDQDAAFPDFNEDSV